MDVIERRHDRLGCEQIAVEARPFLPEPKACLSGPLSNREPLQERALGFREQFVDFLGERLFQLSEIIVDVSGLRKRINQQMDVFGHKNKAN